MQKVKIGFIGAGNMAQAIIHGMLKSGKYLPEQINLYDVDQKKCEKLAEQGMQAAGSSQEVVKQSDIIFLAVKPQNYSEVLQGVRECVTQEKLFVLLLPGNSLPPA